MIAALVLDLVRLRLRHHSAIVAKVVIVAMFGRNTHFREVPVLFDSFLEFVSVLTLIQVLRGQFVLQVDPFFDEWILSLFHESVWIEYFYFRPVRRNVL